MLCGGCGEPMADEAGPEGRAEIGDEQIEKVSSLNLSM
jgi:hypothetical protein